MAVKRLDSEALIGVAVKLRRAERAAPEPVRHEVNEARDAIEQMIGQTISRAAAARVLGVSQTALDRWTEAGEIATVLTSEGRREVPVSHLVELLEDVEDKRSLEYGRALSAVIRDRRDRAEAIDLDELVPRRRKPRTHRTAELRSLAYHRAVAGRLTDELVLDARRRLRRWREQGRIDPRWADEWERILAMPLSRIRREISSPSVRAGEIRQSSPFAGVLTEQERRKLNAAVEERLR
jgi:hypothetical protein